VSTLLGNKAEAESKMTSRGDPVQAGRVIPSGEDWVTLLNQPKTQELKIKKSGRTKILSF